VFINYLKIALRNLKKHKGYSFINIAGLAISMACCILITALVEQELSSKLISKRF
jgi:putative ABC transport system permease protein